jgi:hypothetical protein
LAVDGATMAPDYLIESTEDGEPIAFVDGIEHGIFPAATNVLDRKWSSEIMTWAQVDELIKKLPGMAPEIIKIVENDAHTDDGAKIMKTVFLLMAQYDGAAIIPVAAVVKDYFPHLTVNHFVRKASVGEIKLPLISIEASQKAAKGIHVHDLAEYIDARRKVARKEMEAFLR